MWNKARWARAGLAKGCSMLLLVHFLGTTFPVLAQSESRVFETKKHAVDGKAVIAAEAGNSEIVITTTARLAGAIHSLTWNGEEFIDSVDHGRQLQSASSFNAMQEPHWAEAFNPTEAGSRMDGAGAKSTSRVLHFVHGDRWLQSTNQMAFWLHPGEKSEGHPARNREILSDHLLTKRVRIGWKEHSQIIQYDVTFSVPPGENHSLAQFEVLTGYMPAKFRKFWKYNPQQKELEPLSDGPGEQPFPVVLATESGSHAMGIFSVPYEKLPCRGPGYGRWNFGSENVVKWNTVARLKNPEGVPAGEYSFRNFVLVGDKTTVTELLRILHAEFPKKP